MLPQPVKLPYKPRPHALAFHARHQKSAVVVWHRRAGKTVMCIADLIEKALRNPLEMPQYSYIAPTYKQAKKVAWRYLKKLAEPVTKKVMESELSVELINGAVISLFGADNPDSLRGLYHDGVIIDEYGDIAPMLYGEIIAPAVADRDGWVVFIGTPKGPNHFYELYKDAANDPDWFNSTLRASESGVFSAERLNRIKKQPGMDEDTYNQEFECDFHAANKGAYYAKQLNELEAAGHMGLFPWDPSKPVITAWDIGWSDDTSIWFAQIHGKEIHIIDFWTGSQYALEEVLDELQELPYVYEPFWLPHDAKNKSFQTGKSTRELMWAAGAKTQQVPELSVQDGITAVRATLPKVYFNTGNENVRKYGLPALIMYQREYDEVKRVYRQKPRHDWASNPADAFRYLCLAVNPFTAKTADRTLQMAKPETPANNVLNLENLFADRAARRVNERI
jgi:hypothetical protein